MRIIYRKLSSNMHIFLLAASVAVAAAGSYYANPCAGEPYASQLWCNVSQPFDVRIADLLPRIPLTDKINMFNTQSGGSSAVNMQPYQWWSEALHGIAYSPGVVFLGPTPYATSYPQVTTTAASFNTSLFSAIGSAISTEARVMNNVGNAGLTFWTPNINIFRDPRWGRGHETPGEDPLLTSEYARHFVSSFQEGEDPRYLKSSACCKHYTAYDLENWNNTDRHHFNAIVTQQDLADTFQVPFQACVTQGRVSSIMCSYNEVNGVPSCANEFFNTDILRDLWGFNGYLTSDCGAVSDIYYTHMYENTTDGTCAVSLGSGMDIGCDGFLPQFLPQAIKDGVITEADLDRALTNLFAVRFRLGHFDAVPQPYQQYNLSQWCTTTHQNLSLNAARQGMTLLKNTGALPLNRSRIQTLAVIGPNANATVQMQANYNGPPCFYQYVSPSQGLASYVSSVVSVEGTGIADNNTSEFPAAIAAAKAADATVVVVGLDMTQESEGNDRTIVALPGAQLALIQSVCGVSKGPCIVVCMNGGGVDVSWAANSSAVTGIIWMGYPGPFGGQALAETIFGDNPPAGRLPNTWYPANFINEVSMFDMNMRPGPSVWPPGTTPGRTYRFYTGKPVFTFGEGLSYSKINVVPVNSPMHVSLKASRDYLQANAIHGAMYAPLESNSIASYWFNVTNLGPYATDYVVLGFLTAPGAGTNGIPLRELIGFQRIHLQLYESQLVYIGLQARHLTAANIDGVRSVLPGEYTLHVGHPSEPAYTSVRFVASD